MSDSSPLSPVAQQILEKRYFVKNLEGKLVENWEGLVTRVVNHVCKNEDQEFKNKIFNLIYNTYFLPNSPCLVNAGRKGSAGIFACQPGWSRVNTNLGLIRIDELVKIQKECSLDTYWGMAKAVAFFENGKKEVLRIETEKGYRLDVTPDHKVFVVPKNKKGVTNKNIREKGEWKLAGELLPGDNLCIDFSNEKSFADEYVKKEVTIDNQKQTINLDEDFAILLAYLKCDGNLSYQLGANGKGDFLNLEIIVDSEEALNLLSKNKYIEKFHTIDIKNTNNTYLKRLKTYGKKKYSYLFDFGEFGTHKCSVPNEIFLSPKSVISAFLKSTFECEGHVSIRFAKEGKQSCILSVGMTSEDYIRDVQRLLAMFGIQSSIYGPVVDKRIESVRKNMWYVAITNHPNIRKFANKIGFIGQAKKSALDNYLSLVDPNKNYNKVIFEIRSIKSIGRHEVFDISSSNETYMSESIIVHNCFVARAPGDSWEEICRNIKTFGDVARRGGGNGVCFSKIRPEGDPVFGSTHAKACGPVEVMRMTSEAMSSITQSGFRGMACTPGDTYVSTEKGYIQIKDIVDDNMTNIDVHTQFGKATITNAWHNGKKEVFEIITERGYSVKLTGDHVVYVIDNYNGRNYGKLSKKINEIGKWKKVSDLRENEHCLLINLDEKPFGADYQFVDGVKLDEKMAALIAYLKCDGLVADYPKGHATSLSLDSDESVKFFTEQSFNGITYNLTEKCQKDSGLVVVQKSGKSTEFLDTERFGEFYTYDCSVPKQIFRSPKSVVASFLRASFDAEGGIYVDEKRCRIKTGMTSLGYVQDLQILLSMFGIESSVRRNVQHNNKDGRKRHSMHYLDISNKWHVRKFMNEIMFFSELKNKSAQEKINQMNYSCVGRGNVPSFKKIQRIKSIKSVGIQDVYDISTTNETFLANSITVHNCMATLHVNHPDIEKFIVCKQRERALKSFLKEDIFNHFQQMSGSTHEQLNIVLDKFISNFNISVFASDDFMRAVENDNDWDLTFDNKKYKTIKARDLFYSIAYNAWKNGDPGLLFDDAINNGPYKYSKQRINASNPCVVSGTLVATPDGWRKVEDIKITDGIFCKGSVYPVTEIEKHDGMDVYRVTFTDGDYLDVTASHRFKCVVEKQYKYLRVDELRQGSKVLVECFSWENCSNTKLQLPKEFSKYNTRDLGFILGTVIGDGCYTEKSCQNVKIAFGKHELDWFEKFKNTLDNYQIKYSVEEQTSCYRIISRDLVEICELLKLIPKKAIEKKIPDWVFEKPNTAFMIGLLDGLFSTDGNMYVKKDNPMLRFTSSNIELCRQIRMLLLGFNVHARVYIGDRKEHIYDDPKYGPRKINNNNKKHDIVIMNNSIVNFNHNIELSNPYKNQKIQDVVKNYHVTGGSFKATIKSIEKLEQKQTVYDIKSSYDEWNTKGYISQGCGEQVLPDGSSNIERYGNDGGGSCNLGSIDVSKFVNKSGIDWDSLSEAVKNAVQFLDNAVDANIYPSEGFESWAKDNRPIGLGIMGWADLLLELGITYGSNESTDLASKLSKFMYDTAHEKSVELAKERGTPFACNFKELDYRRNITLLSIAPTGTISLIANCSSSIEPIFSPTIYRYDNTGSYAISHPHADKDYFRCALDKENNGKREVSWQEHILMQAAFQKHIDSAVSKTINLPNSATIEDIKQAYILAWKNGCKGVTVYRDGSKTTQVLNTEQKQDLKHFPRPQEVSCDIHRTMANGKDWHIIVGKLNNSPYEIFAVNGRVELPERGKVIKRKKQHYSLIDEDNKVLIDNLNDEEELINDKLGLETRRFSLELRHGIHPKFIVQQIDKSNESLVSFSKAVSRILKKHYLTDDDHLSIMSDILCPSCIQNGVKNEMISEAGCWKCMKCSYSKCG